MQRIDLFLVLLVLMFVPVVRAQTFSGPVPMGLPPTAEQTTSWPLIETPFNFHTNYAWPSMRQSLLWSSSFYQSYHTLADRALYDKGVTLLGRHLIISGVDLVSFYLPLGGSWLHEEWHRAVMTHRNTPSQNDVYKLKFFTEMIAVSHVNDDDLIRLKRDFPADQVRLSAAGLEAQTEQNLYLEKAKFFDQSPSWDYVILFMNVINNYSYLSTCNNPNSTKTTQKSNEEDGDDISKRDFTGLDCLGWVYDLFRPDEPYQGRGTHPSGAGINRYRTLDHLTDEERSFLKKQEYLSLLSFVDPFLIGRNGFTSELFGEPVIWNAKLQHFLTSFGFAVDGVLFLKYKERGYMIKAHQFFNAKRYFPGLTLELYKWPLANRFLGTFGFSIWDQPVDQRVDETRGALGGSFESTLYYQVSDQIEPYVYASAKDRGWQAGQIELGRGFLFGTGVQVTF